MKRFIFSLIAAIVIGAAAAQAGMVTPDGWTSTESATGFVTWPKDLPAGSRVEVRVEPTQPLTGELRAWFEKTITAMNGSDVVAFGGQFQVLKPADGLELIATDVVTRSTTGTYTFRRYAAAAVPGNKIELIVYTASSMELLEKHGAAYAQILLKWRDERLAAALLAVAATKPASDTEKPSPPLQGVEKVKDSERKAGFIRGTVTGADGKPLAAANIKVLADGVTLRGGERSWFEITVNADGTFEQRVPDGLYRVTADATMDYNGLPVKMTLEGQDAQLAAARLDSTAGIVKDFRLRVAGLKVGGDKNRVYDWFGGAIGLHTERNLLDGALAGNPPTIRMRNPQAKFELKLVPVGPLLDGSKGETQTYVFEADWLGNGFGKSNRYFQNIAVGRYKVSVAMILPDGTRKILKLSMDGDKNPDRQEIDVILSSSAYLPLYLSE